MSKVLTDQIEKRTGGTAMDIPATGKWPEGAIADDAVTLAKMAGLARGKLIVGDSSGNPSALTVGTTGQYLTTDGSDASWGAVDALPTQNAAATGKTLITDGTNASWQTTSPNLFINGDFDIWQRNTTFSWTNATNFYVADRWHFEGNGMSGSLVRQTFTNGQTDVPDGPAYYARWICSTTMPAGQSAWFTQRVAAGPDGLSNKLSGQEVTLSMWLKSVSGTIPSGNLRFVGDGLTAPESTLGAIGPTWAKYTATWTLSAGGVYRTVGLYLPATYSLTNGIDIAHAQLEFGPVATPFKRTTVAQELVECQRYYRIIGTNCAAFGISATQIDLIAPFDTPMRASPSCLLYTTTPAFVQKNVANRVGVASSITSFGATTTGGGFRSDGFSSVGSSSYCAGSIEKIGAFEAEL